VGGGRNGRPIGGRRDVLLRGREKKVYHNAGKSGYLDGTKGRTISGKRKVGKSLFPKRSFLRLSSRTENGRKKGEHPSPTGKGTLVRGVKKGGGARSGRKSLLKGGTGRGRWSCHRRQHLNVHGKGRTRRPRFGKDRSPRRRLSDLLDEEKSWGGVFLQESK